MQVSSVRNINGDSFSAVQDAALTDVVQTNSGNWQDITAYQNASAGYLTAVDLTPYYTTADANTMSGMLSGAIDYVSANAGDEFPASANEAITAYQNASGTYLTAVSIPESGDWSESTNYVQNNSGAIDETVGAVETNSGSWSFIPTYDYTNNGLISAIDTSGLYATSALESKSANILNKNGVIGAGAYFADNSQANHSVMMLNPTVTPFSVTSGIYGPLKYATGAVTTYGSSSYNTQYFGGFLKGNEWYVSNATAGQALRGETHASRGVHLSGATTAGYGFDLSISGVSGKAALGQWRYGVAEDQALRTVSALEYNAVDEISGIAGSAIAQYGAEKQWLQHDDTIVHVANSAQYAFGVNVSALQRLMGVDETVLFSGNTPALNSTFNIAEPFSAFKKIAFRCKNGENAIPTYYDTDTIQTKIVLNCEWAYNWMNKVYFKCDMVTPTSYSYTANTVEILKHTGTATTAAIQVIQNDTTNSTGVWTIIGIGRKA